MCVDGDTALQGSAVELMNDVAKNYRDEQKASVGTNNELPLLFFYYDGASAEVSFLYSGFKFRNSD